MSEIAMSETVMSEVRSAATVPDQADAPDVTLPHFAVRGRLRIKAHAARLFNDGLAAGRNGRPDLARDYFAAFVLWYPHDTDARSALALACWESGDRQAAREHWEVVLEQRPGDAKALRGLQALSG